MEGPALMGGKAKPERHAALSRKEQRDACYQAPLDRRAGQAFAFDRAEAGWVPRDLSIAAAITPFTVAVNSRIAPGNNAGCGRTLASNLLRRIPSLHAVRRIVPYSGAHAIELIQMVQGGGRGLSRLAASGSRPVEGLRLLVGALACRAVPRISIQRSASGSTTGSSHVNGKRTVSRAHSRRTKS
jgi:hypothetical protein